MLRNDEREALQSYRRNCTKDADCEFPLGCLLDGRAGANYCIDSRCMADVQCQDGEVCRLLTTFGNGPLVGVCVPLGIRKEGEKCVRIGRERGSTCGPGLTCSGLNGFCARACRKEDPESCPENFFCADTELEPSCLPTCEKSGCPEGQYCIKYRQGASACAKVHGFNCQETPCPADEKCEVDHEPSIPATAWMRCKEYCREDPNACPPGLICNGFSCHPPCDPNGPNTCAEGYSCQKDRPTRPWVCLPDW
ncbi:hypothetical protein [Pyxidicoccus xibeiensis]|uniref:hypothetical protein n=1 Tax=Pyxidicoccus xibeiensis TaxID=2906759 RepID=UPI0020A75588|nr:hypothetical protein [Pyxidicoccus xibeiensis]MCP3135774.1 hypothetical protein [Pyxidicoccus xibeiensis]